MPFNPDEIRLERFQAELAYHAAYSYWNLRGVLAERWAHGPVFGGYNEQQDQISLTPAITPDDTDVRLRAVYGLRASGVLAEGPEWVAQAQELAADWVGDALEVFNPKRVVRAQISTFSLYPVEDSVQASRKLRNVYYRNEAMDHLWPDSLRQHRDRYHSAVDLLVPIDDRGSAVSVVIGVVGPVNITEFFVYPNADRDGQWWMGMRYLRSVRNVEGIDNPAQTFADAVRVGVAESSELFRSALQEILA
jgi:hypothetical protein